jgi:hypothetical protein
MRWARDFWIARVRNSVGGDQEPSPSLNRSADGAPKNILPFAAFFGTTTSPKDEAPGKANRQTNRGLHIPFGQQNSAF